MLKLVYSRENDLVKGLSKRDEDGGYDICIDPVWFDSVSQDGKVWLDAGDIAMFSTGIRTAFSEDYVAILHERGSTGSKCISLRCGVIDSGYRGIWNVMINNTGCESILFYDPDKVNLVDIAEQYNIPFTAYPITKAIAQVIFQKVYKAELQEISVEDILSISSERGEGKLGSSGK